MNPVFWFLIILLLIGSWFLLSFLFPWIGGLIKRVWDDTKLNINKEDKENEKNEG